MHPFWTRCSLFLRCGLGLLFLGAVSGGQQARADFAPGVRVPVGTISAGGGLSVTGALSVSIISPPLAPTVTAAGTTGAATYQYLIQAVNGLAETSYGGTTSIANGNATLSSANYNALSWAAVTGADSYNVYGRTVSDGYKFLANVAATAYNDTGAATPARVYALYNQTGYINFPNYIGNPAALAAAGLGSSLYLANVGLTVAGKIQSTRYDEGGGFSTIFTNGNNSTVAANLALQLCGQVGNTNNYNPGSLVGTSGATSAHVLIQTTSVNTPALVIKFASGQTADAFSVNNSTGAGLFRIDKTGTPTLVNGVLPYTGTIPLTATGLKVQGGILTGYFTGGTTSAPAAPLVGN